MQGGWSCFSFYLVHGLQGTLVVSPPHPAAGPGQRWPQHILPAGLLHLLAQHELVQHEEVLLKVEDDVQLTNTSDVLVQKLHIAVNDFQCQQPIVLGLNCTAEIQTCIPLTHNFQFIPFKELYIFGFLESTMVTNSLVIFF